MTNRHDGALDALGLSDDSTSELWIERLRSAVDPEPIGTLGRFDLIEELGRGAQGIVYRAWDPETKRHVAIKSIRAGRGAPASAAARYQRELEAVGMLDHPSIVALYGAEWIDGRPILIMPWVDGRTFTEWTDSISPTHATRTIVRAMVEICHGVHHAHRHGILHRDLKPSNMIVDGDGHPRVLDFGLATFIDDANDHAESATKATVTKAGVFVGTARYAAPEQRAADATRVDVRADAYALGVVLREAIADRDDATSVDLQAIVACATADDPGDRYQSVETFRLDLDRWLLGRTVSARPLSARQAAWRAARRHPRTSTAAALVGMLFVGFTISLVALYRMEVKQREHTLVMQTMYESLLSPAGTVLPAQLVTVESQLAVAADRLMRDGDHLPRESRAHLHNVLASRYGGFDLWFKGEPHALEAARLLDELGVDDHPERALSLFHRGRAATFRRQTSALELHRDALAMTRRLYGDTHPQTAIATLAYAHAGKITGRLTTDEQERNFLDSIACYERLGMADAADAADAQRIYADFLLDNARFADAEPLFRHASELLQRRRSSADYRWLLATVSHVRSLHHLERADDARRVLTSAITRAIQDSQHDSEAYLEWSAGQLEVLEQSWPAAISAFDRAWDARARALASTADSRHDTKWLLLWHSEPGLLFHAIPNTLDYARALAASGEPDVAVQLLDELLEAIGPDHRFAAHIRAARAQLAAAESS